MYARTNYPQAEDLRIPTNYAGTALKEQAPESTAQTQAYLYLVAVLQELSCIVGLYIQIVFFSEDTQTDFLYLNDLLLLTSFLFFTTLLVSVLSVVKDLTNGRLGGRCDVHQVHLGLVGFFHGEFDTYYAQLITLSIN